MSQRDAKFADGAEVWYRQWPDTVDGDIDDNGTVRPMTEAEVAEWHARNPPAPLVAPEDFIPEDEVQASIAALTEDIITLRETLNTFGDLRANEAYTYGSVGFGVRF